MGDDRRQDGQQSGARAERERRLDEHASQASALLAARAGARRGGQSQADPARERSEQVRPVREEPAVRMRASGAPSRGASDSDGRRGERRRSGVGDGAASASRGASGGRPRVESAELQPKSLVEFVSRNRVYIAGVVAVVLVVAALVVVMGLMRLPDDTGGGEFVYSSPYDWSRLELVDGRYRYVVDGQVKSRTGIDVSAHNGEIDWEAVAADGIEFAYIRLGYRGATEGDLHVDDRFQENLQGAQAAGLDCGVYFFSQARTVEEAVEDADFVVEQLAGAKLAYPVAFDSEGEIDGIEESRVADVSAEDMSAIAGAFCDRVEQAGYASIVYTGHNEMDRFLYDELADHAIWWAEYGSSAPTANIDIALWQYSDWGEVDGVDGGADMNIDLRGALT